MSKRGKAASTGKRILGKSEFKNGKLDSPGPLAQPPKCPECQSQKVWKAGLRRTRNGDVQRWLCRMCGYRFSEPNVKVYVTAQTGKLLHSGTDLTKQMVGGGEMPPKKSLDGSFLFRSENVGPQDPKPLHITKVGKGLNVFHHYNSECRVCASEREAKNLVEVESRIEKRAAGATTLSKAELKGKIVEYAWNLKRNGYAESTISTYSYLLRLLARKGANLNDPNTVKDVIAMQRQWSLGRKRNAVKAYSLYLKMQGLTWEKPKYRPIEKLPFIPTEQEIDSLISGCSKQMAAFLQVLKESGARRGEAFNLKWTDVDFVTNTIRITPEKGSKARIFKISERLARMLSTLPKKANRIWIYKNVFYLDKGFRRMRKKTAHKLGNPRILMIHFHTLRHWKATIEYARTKDTVYVQQLLGHRSIITTLKYIQLVEMPQEEKFICKVAKNIDQAAELIEAGFEYVTGEYADGGKLFRKRKLSYLGSPSVTGGSWSSMV